MNPLSIKSFISPIFERIALPKVDFFTKIAAVVAGVAAIALAIFYRLRSNSSQPPNPTIIPITANTNGNSTTSKVESLLVVESIQSLPQSITLPPTPPLPSTAAPASPKIVPETVVTTAPVASIPAPIVRQPWPKHIDLTTELNKGGETYRAYAQLESDPEGRSGVYSIFIKGSGSIVGTATFTTEYYCNPNNDPNINNFLWIDKCSNSSRSIQDVSESDVINRVGTSIIELAVRLSYHHHKNGRVQLDSAYGSYKFYFTQGFLFPPEKAIEPLVPDTEDKFYELVKEYNSAVEAGKDSNEIVKALEADRGFKFIQTKGNKRRVGRTIGKKPEDVTTEDLLKHGLTININENILNAIAQERAKNQKSLFDDAKGGLMYLPLESIEKWTKKLDLFTDKPIINRNE